MIHMSPPIETKRICRLSRVSAFVSSLVSAPLWPMNGVFGNSNVAGMNFSQ